MWNTTIKIALATVLLLLTLASLPMRSRDGLVPDAQAQIEEFGCNVGVLRGTYGNSFEFLNTSTPNSVPAMVGDSKFIPGAGVGLLNFNGRGSYTGQATASVGGLIFHNTVSGTYTVNPNCTGTRVIVFDGGPLTATLDFVIVDRGREVREVSTGQGDVALGSWKKQF